MSDKIQTVQEISRELYETEGSGNNSEVLEIINSWFKEGANIPEKYYFIVKKIKKNKETLDKLRKDGVSNRELYRLLILNLNSFARSLRLKKQTKYAVRRLRETDTKKSRSK